MVDWIGAEQTTPGRYDFHEVVEAALPYLERARQVGVQTLLDCTPAFLGRDVAVLQFLAQKTGLHILTNTGIYGAMDASFVPAYAFETSAESLAEAWIQEWEQGIDGTGILPAFMKIGVDPGPLSPIDRKLVETAAITHRATGLNIHSHTTDAEAGRASSTCWNHWTFRSTRSFGSTPTTSTISRPWPVRQPVERGSNSTEWHPTQSITMPNSLSNSPPRVTSTAF